MSNHDNHRRDEVKRTEHGPSWKSTGNYPNPPHVARTRKKWKRIGARAERRTDGASFGGYLGMGKTTRKPNIVDGSE
jgi:hypothetical protein